MSFCQKKTHLNQTLLKKLLAKMYFFFASSLKHEEQLVQTISYCIELYWIVLVVEQHKCQRHMYKSPLLS